VKSFYDNPVFHSQPLSALSDGRLQLTVMRETADLHVQIVRFVLDHQPAIVACELIDAEGQRHTFIDKVWIFVDQNLDAESEYPVAGEIRCAVLSRWRDARGRELVRVNTADPDSIESTVGASEFVVLQNQVSDPQGELG
jgi:hypothetical protein